MYTLKLYRTMKQAVFKDKSLKIIIYLYEYTYMLIIPYINNERSLKYIINAYSFYLVRSKLWREEMGDITNKHRQWGRDGHYTH